MNRDRQEKRLIGARLREARERARISKEDAAEAAGAQLSAVSAWERGTSLPNLVQLRGLLGSYGITPYEVLFGCTPVQFTEGEAVQLASVARAMPQGLRVKVEMMLAITRRAKNDAASVRA